ncbi:peptidase inhibitor family I36 protein [Sphaerisporangium sp. B11E5]|uniref:peptidase inhibitor family I36 protein n=1 Tax=Sphaerisporangium sp. B11E5 TaxID=3153563 RepID=UPI00325E0019
MRKTLIAGVIAAACATAGVTPAQAQTKAMAWGPCAAGYVCLYEHTAGEGFIRAGYGPNTANVGTTFNDRASSVWNLTSSTVCFYRNANFVGYLFSVSPGGWIAVMEPADNDEVTSYGAC